tara:strand:+ start:254 stop:481 length:228 start_codon:yes stop_codon:yes gene_type:complete
MITNPAMNLIAAFERMPNLTRNKSTPDRGLLSSKKKYQSNYDKKYTPAVQAAMAYQRIKKDRLEIIEMRKTNGSI